MIYIIFGIIGSILLLFFLITLACFLLVFYSPKRRPVSRDEYDIPKGEIYQVHRDKIIEWTKLTRSLPYEEMTVTSHDGLTLRGRYYEYKAGAPTEILFHGYRGNAERDMSGGVYRARLLGRNAILVDHRASGESDGHIISFGINERLDCLLWIKAAEEKLGKDAEIMITGISMGAATVMMAAGLGLPGSVKGVLADCGYTSPKEIIIKVLREDMHLPSAIFYPIIRLGARLFGRFDIESASPIAAMEKIEVPLILYHGTTDAYVPMYMSEKLYDACKRSDKRIVRIEGAGHGLAFPTDMDAYVDALRDFSDTYVFTDKERASL